MTTSEKTPFLSNLLPGNKPPQFVLGYLASTLMAAMHDALLNAFQEQEEEDKDFSKAVLARRLSVDPALVTRWLSGPSNYTAETLATLLAGMGYELSVQAVKINRVFQHVHNVVDTRYENTQLTDLLKPRPIEQPAQQPQNATTTKPNDQLLPLAA